MSGREGDGRGWAYASIAAGGAISVYANIAEKYVRYDPAARAWVANPHPAVDGVVLSAAAPVVLFLMSEVFTLVRGKGAAAWVVRVAAAVVAAVAFVTSYQHLHGLLLARGESDLTAQLYPFGIDGLMVGATAVLWQLRRERAGHHDQNTDADQDSAQDVEHGDGEPTSDPEPTPAAATPVQAAPAQDPRPALTTGKPATTGRGSRPVGRPGTASTARPAGRSTKTAARSTARPGRPAPVVTEADVLAAGVTAEQLAVGRQVAADLAARGEALTRTGLFDGIREQGTSIGTGPGGQLLALLKAELANAPAQAAADGVGQAVGEAGAPVVGEQTGIAGVVDLVSHHHPTDGHDADLDHDDQPDHDDQEDQLQYLAHANGPHHDDGLVATIGGTR